jgi:hypothetical protein
MRFVLVCIVINHNFYFLSNCALRIKYMTITCLQNGARMGTDKCIKITVVFRRGQEGDSKIYHLKKLNNVKGQAF